MKSHKYASNTTHEYFYHLSVLGIFLEWENLDFSREVADIWANELCIRFFGKTRIKALRHILDLYDAFIADEYQVPKSVHVPHKSVYLTLPDWCK